MCIEWENAWLIICKLFLLKVGGVHGDAPAATNIFLRDKTVYRIRIRIYMDIHVDLDPGRHGRPIKKGNKNLRNFCVLYPRASEGFFWSWENASWRPKTKFREVYHLIKQKSLTFKIDQFLTIKKLDTDSGFGCRLTRDSGSGSD